MILQALEKDRLRRFPSVAAFAAALAPYAGASSAQHVERAAKVQQVEIAPSRPTIELLAPSDASLAKAAGTSPAHAEAPVIAEAAPRAAPPRRPPTWIAAAVAGTLLVVSVPIAIYFGLQARAGERDAPPTVPTASDTTASPPTATVATASTAAEASKTNAPPTPPPVAPIATGTATAATASLATPSAVPISPSPARPHPSGPAPTTPRPHATGQPAGETWGVRR